MHFLYPLAALAATTMAIPAQLVESNTLKALSNAPLLITPSGNQKTASSKRDAEAEPDAASNLSIRQTTSTPQPPNFVQRVLIAHNLHRANHSAPPLTWDPTIASAASTLAQRCAFAHDTSIGGGGYGQNLAVGIKESNISSVITNLWYGSEVNAYKNFYGKEPDMSASVFGTYGHFSQVVWVGTTAVGCAVADCTAKGVSGVGANVPKYVTVCNYKAPGNYVGRFKTNVLRPKGDATAKWNSGW